MVVLFSQILISYGGYKHIIIAVISLQLQLVAGIEYGTQILMVQAS